jgi:hypothetical protein
MKNICCTWATWGWMFHFASVWCWLSSTSSEEIRWRFDSFDQVEPSQCHIRQFPAEQRPFRDSHNLICFTCPLLTSSHPAPWLLSNNRCLSVQPSLLRCACDEWGLALLTVFSGFDFAEEKGKWIRENL